MPNQKFSFHGRDCILRMAGDSGIKRDVILNVSQTGDSKGNLFLDILNYRNADNIPTYSSSAYSLQHHAGLFNFMEDVFLNRYSFFYSNVNVEAWLTALHDCERIFFEKHKLSFIDYYDIINETTKEYVENNSNIRAKYPMEHPLYGEYGIVYEALDASFEKLTIVAKDGYLDEIIPLLVETFYNILGSMLVEHFAGICIATPPNGKSRIIMEQSVKLPLVMRSKRFIPIFFDMMMEPLVIDDGISLFNMADTEIEVWRLKETTKLSDIMELCDDDGLLTVQYGKDDFGEHLKLFDGVEFTYRHKENELYNSGFVASIG